MKGLFQYSLVSISLLFSAQVLAEDAKNLNDKVNIGGVIEVEANWSSTDYASGGSDDESRAALATVELGVDADISEHVSGHLLFLYEDGDDGVSVDEGYITLDGKDKMPFYLQAGKMAVPFGWFESHFISDPLTLELGETKEDGVTVGYADNGLNISATLFNGDVNERGSDDDHIDGWVLNLSYETDQLGDIGLMGGIAYINNIAESDGLEEQINDPDALLDDYVAGMGMFLGLSFKEALFVKAEYVGALDEFKAGELAFDGGKAYAPKAWNFEAAYNVMDGVELGIKYSKSDEGGDFLAENQWGAVASWEVLPGATLAVEYLRSEYANDDKTDSVTAQLGVAF